MKVTKEKIEQFEISSRKEWLITNGIGGYASSTIIGLNTRKYHGLLVAALGESGNRCLVLSKLNESLVINNKTYTLTTNQCNDYVEAGYVHQDYFRRGFLPEFQYTIDDVEVNKKVALKYGENKLAVVYKIKTGKDDVTFRIQPLINYRSFHAVRSCSSMEYTIKDDAVNVVLNSHGDILHMKTSIGEFEEYDRTYYRNMYYLVEEERGLDAYEDHFMPGAYSITLPKRREIVFEFVASIDNKSNYLQKVDGQEIILSENTRFEKICKIAEANSLVEKHLAVSADAFVVKRGERRTIIAGYPWFGDWGRDTFIAFEGILLKTNRFKEAKEVLTSFKSYIKNGLIPNLIDEKGGSAYNTVDASLWYIDAVHKYYNYTHDVAFVENIYPKLMEIMDGYRNGTDYGIHMDPEDKLITAGDETTQLTWMDAKVDGFVPTPRNGKAVEINALWYNALKIMEEFASLLGFQFDFEFSEKVKESFKKFYAERGLIDVIEPNDYKIRPNQILAIGLDYSPVDKEKAKEILELVEEKLYTKKGLKTLSADDYSYKGYYEGDVYKRDTSYHQGTIWPWLLQFYYTASRKYKGKYFSLEDIMEMLEDGCIGSVCEIYDAEEPRKAKGAYAQAWSVAMALLNC